MWKSVLVRITRGFRKCRYKVVGLDRENRKTRKSVYSYTSPTTHWYYYIKCKWVRPIYLPPPKLHKMEYFWGTFFMQKSNYLIKRKDRNYYTYQSKFNIPVSLQNHFGRKSFKISLKSGKYNQSCSLSNRLQNYLRLFFKKLKWGTRN